ncbi:MAG: hypothetical protein SYC29_02445 [Planctomycetota bacterium]|nr:hypothetical protein [Planctomycetota bacterium]
MWYPARRSRLPALALSALLGGLSSSVPARGLAPDVAPPDAPPAPQEGEAEGIPLESLNRVVRHFDFEEAQTARLQFPLYFKRTVAEDRGFPRFGEMSLTDEVSSGGDWSFRYDLAGGSLSAGVPTGIVPVLPLADYAISAKVRTRGLRHAGARLLAWLTDARGSAIPGSLMASPVVRTDGAWETLAVSIRGDDPEAADLLFELQVLQPDQLSGEEEPSTRPRLQDTSGQAWFDDVIIRHVPRIELSTTSACNLITLPEPAALEVLVRDVTNEALTARLLISDLAGRVAHEDSFPAPRGRRSAVRELPQLPCGWYRAELVVNSETRLVGRERLSFTILPAENDLAGWRMSSLGVVLPPAPPARLALAPELVRRLHVGSTVVGVWDESVETEPEPLAASQLSALRDAVEQLLDWDMDVTFALNGVPRRLAAAAGVDSSQILELLGRNPRLWRPALDELLINFGLRVRRWQLGHAGGEGSFARPDLRALIDEAGAGLAPFVPGPVVVVPSTADRRIPPDSGLAAMQVTVPCAVAPDALEEYAAPWLAETGDVHLILEPAPDELYDPRQQTIDLLLRTLHAWRAGVPRMSIPAPWRWRAEKAAQPEPEPAFAAWRGLADALRGRRFVGEMPLAEGIHCWLMAGDERGDHALVAWADRRAGDPPIVASLVLADHAVRLTDSFGNRRIIPLSLGAHEIPLTDMPVFVEGINLQLAQFRAGFEITPSFVPAMHRLHEHELVLHNPWDMAVSGSIRLRRSSDWRLTPRRLDFIVRSGETVRLPINIIFDRSIIAGEKSVEADVRLAADRDYRLHLRTGIEVGWKNIEMTAIWHIADNARTGQRDLIITQYVTNRGERPVNLDAFLRAPGVGQNRRVIAALEPDTTAVKTFNIPDGAARLAGRLVRLSVADRDGVAQLNRLLEIPDLIGETDPVRQTDASPGP